MSNYLGPVEGVEAVLIFEMVVLLTILAAGFLVSRRPWATPRRFVGWVSRLANRRWLCVVLMGLLSGSGSAAVSTFIIHSQPRFHDEFSYLLGADTFAHGRLTNPPHPFAVHFETFHVLQSPTYASKYPPAQGLFLALGQVLTGRPLVGVWLEMAFLGGALCWMLQGWLPPRWALVGSLLAVGRLVLASPFLGSFGYWGHSYWGGAVAAIGGALLFGALRRLARRPSFAMGLVFAAGLVLLANARPFEGLVASVPAGILLLVCLWRQGRPGLVRVFPALLAVLVPAALAMGVYNTAVTGHPLTMPYAKHEQLYAIAPPFLWQPLRPEPSYNHELIRSFWTGWAAEAHREQQTLSGIGVHLFIKLLLLWLFFLGFAQSIALLGLMGARRNFWVRFALTVCALLLLALFLEQGILPHYAGPITGLIFYLIIQGCRYLRNWRPQGRPVGRTLVQRLAVIILLVWGMSVLHAVANIRSDKWFHGRARLAGQLEQTPGKHLVLVRYDSNHNEHQEWVYNGADLEGGHVIWARELGDKRDRELIQHYGGRKVWLLEADATPPRLTPYPLP
jgi:hypothetical protein